MKNSIGVNTPPVLLAVFLAAYVPGQISQTAPPGESGGSSDRKCAVGGVVTNIRTGVAVGRVAVELRAITQLAPHLDAQEQQRGGSLASNRAPYRVTSDPQGVFCFKNIADGRYSLSGRKLGFLDTNYGARVAGETGTALTVEFRRDREVVLTLIPQATISGRVTDIDGEPLDSGLVQVLCRLWINGAHRYVPLKSARPNDLGEYRLANLAPCTYYVLFQPAPMDPARSDTSDGESRIRTVRTYYPATTTFSQALPIQISEGEDLPNLDIRAQRSPTYRLSGRIEGAGLDGGIGAISILREEENPMVLAAAAGNLGANNSFDFPAMAPATYKLTYLASSGDGGTVSRLLVSIVDKDVDDAKLYVSPPATVRGRIRVENAERADLSTVELQLKSSEGVITPSFSAEVAANGTFSVRNVSAGKYFAGVTLPEALYVKSVRYAETDIWGKEFDVTGGGSEMEVVIRDGSAQVEGAVVQSQGNRNLEEDIAMRYFMLIPENRSIDGSGIRSGTMDSSGKFVVKGLAPGRYRALALASFDPVSVQNPAALAALQPLGTAVDLGENDRASISLEVIAPDRAAQAFRRARTE